MNNKRIGTEWERQVLAILKADGYWAHFITPDYRGAQPFDIIAVQNGRAIAVECKTLAPTNRYFSISRLEENQLLACTMWREKNNGEVLIAIKWGDQWTTVTFDELERTGRIDMKELAKEKKLWKL